MSLRKQSLRSSKSKSVFDSSNPEDKSISIVELKKKKDEPNQLKNLKLTIQKELKLLLKKDENLLKNYMKKKQELKKEVFKQQRFTEDKNYKSWLQQQKRKSLQKQKDQTQKLRINITQGMHSAINKNLQQKRSTANKTKSTISDWKLQKYLSQQKLKQRNQKIFIQTGQRRNQTRQSSRKFFQKKHSLIIKTCRQQIERSQKQLFKNKKMVQKMQIQMLDIKQKSENKLKLIEQLQDDIMSVKNQSLALSRSRSRLITPKKKFSVKDVNEKAQQSGRNLSSSKSSQRKLSLPALKLMKRNHNQN